MIQASLYGRLGGDPAERTTKAGTAMATASLAVNAARYGEDEQTVWVSLVAFGRQAEALLRHAKGELLAAMGPLHRTRFTGRDGQEREGWSLTAEAILSARTARPGGRRKSASNNGTPGDDRAPAIDPGLDDEIPF